MSNTIRDFGPFECFGYKLYDKAYDLTSQVECVFEMSLVTEEASEGLIDYQSCFSEREKLIWFFRNRKNHYGSVYYEFPDNWKTNSLINYKRDIVKLTLDISGYEYVMDYFITVDKLYANLMKKYQPLPEHFEASESGSIDHSLENYLRLHNKHLDVIKQYGRKRH